VDVEAGTRGRLEGCKVLPDVCEQPAQFACSRRVLNDETVLRVRLVGLLGGVGGRDDRAFVIEHAKLGVAVLGAAKPDAGVGEALEVILVPTGTLLELRGVCVDVGVGFKYLGPQVLPKGREHVDAAVQPLRGRTQCANDLLVGEEEAAEENLAIGARNLFDQRAANICGTREVIGRYVRDVSSPGSVDAMDARSCWRSREKDDAVETLEPGKHGSFWAHR
jgi:hypothetical protein